MSKLRALLHVLFLESFGLNVFRKTKDAELKKKYKNQIYIMLLALVSIVFCSSFYSFQMINSFKTFNAENLLLAMIMVSSSALTFMTMIYKSSASLFSFKDYDEIMSLPIKTSTVVVSRVIGLYLGSIITSFILMIPAGVVYALITNPSFWFYPVFIITLLFVPLIPIILGCLIGLVITLISSYFKKTNFFKIVLSLIFMIAIMAFSFMSDGGNINYYSIIEPFMNKLSKIYPMVTFYVDSLVKFDVLSLILFIGISLVLFIGFTLVTTKFYKKINTFVTTKRTSSNYKVTKMKTVSARNAVIKKELKRFFSSANYLLNAGVGLILSTIVGICLLVFNAKEIEMFLQIPDFSIMISNYAPIILCLLVGMSTTTAASISLEGKNLWILKTIPVKTSDILMAKLLVTVILGGSAILVNGTLFVIALKTGLIESFLIYILPILFVFFMGSVGLIANLKNPNFDWKNEMTVIKQSMPVFITTMVGMLGPVLLISIVSSYTVNILYTLVIIGIVLLCADIYLYNYINTKGVDLFNKL